MWRVFITRLQHRPPQINTRHNNHLSFKVLEMYCQNHEKACLSHHNQKIGRNAHGFSTFLHESLIPTCGACPSEDSCFLLQVALLPLGQALKVRATYAEQPLEVRIRQVILKQERGQETVRLTSTAGLLSLQLCEQNLLTDSSPHLSPNQSSVKTQQDYKTGLSNLLSTPVTPMLICTRLNGFCCFASLDSSI